MKIRKRTFLSAVQACISRESFSVLLSLPHRPHRAATAPTSVTQAGVCFDNIPSTSQQDRTVRNGGKERNLQLESVDELQILN
jgi:hypothetical protein